MVSKRHQQHAHQQPQQQLKTNPYQAFYAQTTAASPVNGASNNNNNNVDDDIAVGVAMDTRNYQELLKQAAAPPPVAVTVRGTKPRHHNHHHHHSSNNNNNSSSSNGRRQSGADASSVRFPVLLGGAATHDDAVVVGEALTDSDGEADVVAIDATVRGLPVETRNYEAFARSSVADVVVPAAPVSAPASHRQSVNESKPRFPIKRADSSSNTDDADETGDTVYGLPISTGNYAALVGADAKVKQPKSRSRGFSDQAQSGAGPERRASAPAFNNARSPAQYATAPVAATASMVPRGSCFETRRAATVAIVPFTGWLLIQRKTFRKWTKHYAVLSGVEFKYSRGPGHAPKGFGTIQSVQPWTGVPLGLVLVFSSGSQLPVRCSSASEHESWLRALEQALDKLQHLTGHSKTSYTVTASEQHDGYLFKQDVRAGTWRRHYFVVRIDGYLECKVTEDASSVDSRHSGYIQSVSFADVHPNGIAIELDTGASVLVYAESYDDRMLWYAAMSSAALANDQAPQSSASTVKSTYVQTARGNHAGWLYKQSGLFKTWKRVYFTLHGAELSYARDTNARVGLCDTIHGVADWSGKQNGLEIRLKSGRVWKVYADSYDTAKRWRTLMMNATARSDSFNVKKYIASRKRKGLSPVFGGWLTNVKDPSSGASVRQFYVVDGGILGDASEVDHQLRPIGRVVDVGASRDLDCGLVVSLINGTKLKLAADSVDSCKAWYEILKTCV